MISVRHQCLLRIVEICRNPSYDSRPQRTCPSPTVDAAPLRASASELLVVATPQKTLNWSSVQPTESDRPTKACFMFVFLALALGQWARWNEDASKAFWAAGQVQARQPSCCTPAATWWLPLCRKYCRSLWRFVCVLVERSHEVNLKAIRLHMMHIFVMAASSS